MTVERLNSTEFVSKKKPAFVDGGGLLRLYDKLAFQSNLILSGPKGLGKSLSIASFCAERGLPLVTFDCSEDVRRAQLIGLFVLRGNETPFVLGPLPTAFEVANEMGSCVLLLEEINSLSPASQKLLNPISDFRRRMEVPEAKRVFELREGAKLWITATMNDSSYGGVFPLNEDLKSRFRILPVEYPTAANERNILNHAAETRGFKIEAGIMKHLLTLAKETRQGQLDYALSTRDLIQILEDTEHTNIETALFLTSGKYEGESRRTFYKRIESIFGVVAGCHG